MDSTAETTIYSGILRKKGARANVWSERFFILKGYTLYYYVKSNDTEPKGSFPLQHTSQVSSITSSNNRKRNQFLFKVTWKVDDDFDEKEDTKESAANTDGKGPPELSPKGKEKKKRDNKKEDKGLSGSKVAAVAVGGVVVGALTAGVGLLAGMMVVGMGAAGGGAAAAMNQSDAKERVLVLASDSYQEAANWVNAIEAQIQDMGDHVLGLSNVAGSSGTLRVRNHSVRPEVRLQEVEDWITTSKWKIYDVYEGVRLLQICRSSDSSSSDTTASGASLLTPISAGQAEKVPCMRVNIGVNASTADTFSSIINFSNSLQTGIIRSVRTIENIDNFTDVIHVKLEPMFLYPTWTAPRDFCLIRYWRDNFDGSYVICLDSTTHPECPSLEGYVRGELHAAYIVAPPKLKMNAIAQHNRFNAKDAEDEDGSECLLSFIAQLNPGGWLWESFGYRQAFLKEFMLHVLDVRDAMDSERFQQVQFDPVNDPKNITHSNSALSTTGGCEGTSGDAAKNEGSVATVPPPVLSPTMWMDSDATTFRVRGKDYMTSNRKCASAPALFKFIGIDLFETPEAQKNMGAHPKNRVNLAHQRGEDAWIFILNIMVPGTPYLNFVCYFQGDRELIEQDTPFGKVARPFFNGNDDEFRNNRFKLIPKIVDGNLMIKMAVKDTPTLLGNKLKQYYFKGDNYFEIDVDVGSSSVARNVVGLAIGYSKAIVVDMGFCLQGNEADELPEVLMGCCSCYHVDMSTGIKL